MTTNDIDYNALADLFPAQPGRRPSAPKPAKPARKRATFELVVTYTDGCSMTEEGTKRDLLVEFEAAVKVAERKDSGVSRVELWRSGDVIKAWEQPPAAVAAAHRTVDRYLAAAEKADKRGQRLMFADFACSAISGLKHRGFTSDRYQARGCYRMGVVAYVDLWEIRTSITGKRQARRWQRAAARWTSWRPW